MQTNVIGREGGIEIRLVGRFDFNSHREFREAVEHGVGGYRSRVDRRSGRRRKPPSSTLPMMRISPLGGL